MYHNSHHYYIDVIYNNSYMIYASRIQNYVVTLKILVIKPVIIGVNYFLHIDNYNYGSTILK